MGKFQRYNFPPNPVIENNMEAVIRQCPHIGIKIFENLDFESLKKCNDVSKDFRSLLDPENRTFLIRKIAETFVADSEGVIGQLQGIANPTLKFLSEEAGKSKLIKLELFQLLHFIASIGEVDFYRKVFLASNEKNPKSRHGFSPLHMAAKHGHIEICHFIFKNVLDKNPKSDHRITPLHVAASGGHLEICQLILQNVDYTTELSSKTADGNTPLHYASLYGQSDVCNFFMANGADPNVINAFGRSSHGFMTDVGSRLSGRNCIDQYLEMI